MASVPPMQPTPPANGNGNMGLFGWWKVAGNATAMVVIAGSFLFLQWHLINNNRNDIQEGRQNFRETLREIMHEQRQNTHDMSEALRAEVEATKALTEEIRRRTPPKQD